MELTRADLHIEIVFGLKVAHEISFAFINQVPIHRAFFVNRNFAPDRSLPEAGSDDANRNNWPGIDLKCDIRTVRLRIVFR